VEPQRYWFEEVPEEQRYWFLVPWGPSLSQEAEREDSVFSPEEQDELEEIERRINFAEVFGITEAEVRELDRQKKERSERMEAVGYAPRALSVPWWSEVHTKWEYHQDLEYVQAPMLFSTKQGAEEQLRSIEDSELERYRDLVDEYGEAETNRAFDNTSPLSVKWVDWYMLLDKLGDSDFPCVIVDHKLKMRQDFVEELKKRFEEQEV
jgi:hypothetical protein